MDESFALVTWEDANSVQNEEVICNMENEMIHNEEEFVEDQDPSQAVEQIDDGNIVYLTDDNVLLMQRSGGDPDYQTQFMDCQVTEEVVAEQWGDECPDEIIIGSEEAVDDSGKQAEDCEIPLPTDQDEYTAARPYPCDFCSRRFRKKANLMNHMVAHQTDRPHGCNLCGMRYMRKCELMSHLKIHAFIPETDGMEEDEMPPLDNEIMRKRKSFNKKRKKPKIKEEFEIYENEDIATSSRGYKFSEEEIRMMEEEMTNDVKEDYDEYLQEEDQESQSKEIHYPISDPRKPFVCQHCGVGFAREKALASHARIHGGDSPFECQKCGEMFWDIDLMKEHVRAKHGNIDMDEDEDEEYSEDDNKYGTFYCSTCGLSFHRQDNLRRHQKVHVKEEYGYNEFGHVCNVCGESFPEALDLLAHAEVHARGPEFRCMICGEICADHQSVAVHVQAAHGDNLPPNTCMLCGKACKDRRTLLKHAWEHSKEKLFACSKCAKTFHNKARLKRHMLSHRNKVVSCDVCGEEFPDGRSLMNHRHSHSSVSGRQFPCRECGKTFGSRSSQQIHIRIHTGERPYGCRFCWKAFADGGTLRKHERIHTGEKPYACAVCPRAFNQRVVLREHIRSHHSGPDPKYTHSMTPYCCSVCSDMFATSQDLIVHLIHHCDMNTAMKRQPHVGPRKYKRRRKLKPHELELMSNRGDEEVLEQELPVELEEDFEQKKKVVKKPKKSASPKAANSQENNFNDMYDNSYLPEVEEIGIINNSNRPVPKLKRKLKPDALNAPSRPKMIHTQKTRVPVEPGEDGRVRHKTKTMITRTQPVEVKSSSSERIRPRTKNVSYHVFNAEKLPLATFPEDAAAVNNLLKQEQLKEEIVITEDESNGLIYMDHAETPDIASEEVIETETALVPLKVETKPRRSNRSTRNSTAVAAAAASAAAPATPGNKVVRLVKSGMIVSKHTKKKNGSEGESVVDEFEEPNSPSSQDYACAIIKQEIINPQEITDPSALHELAEISMQHAQNLFKCEMCSKVFSDRGQLLVHVPIHI